MRSTSISAFIFCLALATTAWGQLDSIHWVPPMHGRQELGPQYFYLSTPEPDLFPIIIRYGDGGAKDTVFISNSQPAEYYLEGTNNTDIMVTGSDLQKPLDRKGLVLVAEKKFYVNFRFHSDSGFQAADLTAKGQAALGTEFRIAHFYQSSNSPDWRSNFVGVMAVEDSTLVTLSDFAPNCAFQIGGATTVATGPQQVMLMAGQSTVFSQYLGSTGAQPSNGLIGALLSSNKPVAVNCGSWTGSPVDNSNDVGIDQIAPFDKVGEEYILCKGNGSTDLETPIVIAHKDNTGVYLNGEATPAAVLSAGQYFRIPTSRYSSAGNLYIYCTEAAFVYQIIGGVPSGDDAKRTGGLIFVPPISCAIPNSVNNIYRPNRIGSIIYDGGLMIVAMKDSTVEVRSNGNLVSLGSPSAVPGNPDFVTYRRLDLFSSSNPPNTASVIAHGAVQVALFGRNGAAGYGAFYSGFSKTEKATVELELKGDGVCPDTLYAHGHFDGVQWYYADSLLTYGPDSTFVAYAPGLYTARGYLGVCRRADFAEDTISAFFNSPVFPFTVREPSCYGFADGVIDFGTPSGGLAPYQYSVNQGFSFSYNPHVTGLKAGNYQLVARDSTGCYNRPLDIDIGQPDSLSVDAEIVSITEPVKVGDNVLLQGTPSRDVLLADWEPSEFGIEDFLRFTAKPVETTNYVLIVTDAEGCTASDTVRIVIQPNIYAPNVIYPESSTGNDVFTLFCKDNLLVNWLRIYDRWGNQVFDNYAFSTNDRSEGWDGSFRGKPMMPGVFVFVAEVEYEPGRTVMLKGDITLIR